MAFAILGSGARAQVTEFCESFLQSRGVSAAAPYRFPKGLDVVNLRQETELIPEVKSWAELQKAFDWIREAHVVKIDALKVSRKLLWPKLVAAESGYVRIPWKFSQDHCYLRAEMAAAALAGAGFPLPVAISVVTDQHRIARATEENEEPETSQLPALRPQSVWSISGDPKQGIFEFQQAWNWHVAVAYTLNGELWMLDPALSYEKPLRFGEWYLRLAEGVTGAQVEVGWPFSLGHRWTAGQRLSLEKCFSRSLPQSIVETGDEKENKLSQVYWKFQKQILLGHCNGRIDPSQMAKLNALFWSVAGTLEKISDVHFLRPRLRVDPPRRLDF